MPASGVSIKELAEFLGHTDLVFTLRVYARLRPRMTAPAPSSTSASPAWTQTECPTRTERTTVNKNFTVSGRLEVILTRGWEKQPALVRALEVGEAEAE